MLAVREPGYDPGGCDRQLWVKEVLVAGGVRPPVQQHRVQVGGRTYVIDLAYPPEMVGLEFDGWDVHGTFEAFHGDRRRPRTLVANGWAMLPVTSRTDPAELMEVVRATLAARAERAGC